ncbi:MAG TPA: site-2 protease family protein [Candidatus Krumholzibacteria bacterium]|nr:site-2 protease family protein [Candidatus Krumholzibacteria bacterium]
MTPDFLTAAVGLVAFIFSVIVHENAHGLTAERFGDPTARDLGRITMNPIPHIDPIGSILLPLAAFLSGIPFLGWAKPVPVNGANLRNPVVHGAYVAAAGPISNFLLALAAAVLWIIVGLVFKHVPGLIESGERSLYFFNTLCSSLIMINCVLAMFNLLPVPPLDGHWILMRYLPPGPREALRSIGRWGFFILILLLWSGLLWRILGPPLSAVVSGYHALVTTVVRAL